MTVYIFQTSDLCESPNPRFRMRNEPREHTEREKYDISVRVLKPKITPVVACMCVMLISPPDGAKH